MPNSPASLPTRDQRLPLLYPPRGDAPHAHALAEAAHRRARRDAHHDVTLPLYGLALSLALSRALSLALGRAGGFQRQQACERRQQRRPLGCA